MKEDNAKVITVVGPDLLVPPHVLPLLMELFAGDIQQASSQQEQLLAHLATCHYCRTAVMVLLSYAQEYDCRNNDPEKPTRDLLTHFANISRAIEAREAQEFERLGVYAETIVAEGQEKAAQRFPDVAAHLKMCPDCRSALDATVAFISGTEETG
jgi:predicted anti-sigma-YlaC factor YlaD